MYCPFSRKTPRAAFQAPGPFQERGVGEIMANVDTVAKQMREKKIRDKRVNDRGNAKVGRNEQT